MFPEITSALQKRMRLAEVYREERAPCTLPSLQEHNSFLLWLTGPCNQVAGLGNLHFHTETFHVLMKFADEQMKDHSNCLVHA